MRYLAAALLVLFSSNAFAQATRQSTPPQSKRCMISDMEGPNLQSQATNLGWETTVLAAKVVNSGCQEGDALYYYGQLPQRVAAAFCRLDHQIIVERSAAGRGDVTMVCTYIGYARERSKE